MGQPRRFIPVYGLTSVGTLVLGGLAAWAIVAGAPPGEEILQRLAVAGIIFGAVILSGVSGVIAFRRGERFVVLPTLGILALVAMMVFLICGWWTVGRN